MADIAHYVARFGPFGPQQIHVERVEGREALSNLYRWDVTISTEIPRDEFERLALARRAVLVLQVAGQRRTIHGIVDSVRIEGRRHARGRPTYQYRIRLAPKASLLRHRRGNRIFRDRSVPEAIAEVLSGGGVASESILEGKFPTRDYQTQYEESDWAFVKRVAAESGILFYFRQPAELVDAALSEALDALAMGALPPGVEAAAMAAELQLGPEEVVVLTDRARYLPLGGLAASFVAGAQADAIPYRPVARGVAEGVTRFALTRSVRATAAAYRDYDDARPRTAISAKTSLEGADALIEPKDLEIYDHGGRHLFPDDEESKAEPVRMLQRARRHARRAEGSGVSGRLGAGTWFQLDEHEELAGAYVVTRALHRGSQSFMGEAGTDAAGGHAVDFESVPADVPFLPKRPPPRVTQACLTATVIGPAEQEVYTSRRAEVKVQFHWDRRGPSGDDSSAWIRTMQGWSGAAWGMQFIPRIGSEVVVTFEAGDPDKPIVLGCLYNEVLPTPFALPGDRTRSGIRTRSTPESDGFNELSFEDAKDREQVYLRAQRDWDAVVERHRTATVRGEDRTRVDGHQSTEVHGDLSVRAERSRVTHVRLDDRVEVRGTRHIDVAGDLQESVQRDRIVRVERAERREIGEGILRAHADVTADVRGSATLVVGRADARRALTARVEGVASVSASTSVEIASESEVVLRCGSSVIRLTPSGIEIAAGKVELRGEDARLLLAEGEAKLKTASLIQGVSDDKVVLVSAGASLGLGSEAKLDGAQVLLNSPTSATDTIEVSNPSPTTIELEDQDGNPLPYQPFRLILDDGSEVTGVTNGDGKAIVHVSCSGHIVFPDLADAGPA